MTGRTAYRPAEAARALGVSTATMARWIAKKTIPSELQGGCRLIPADAVEMRAKEGPKP